MDDSDEVETVMKGEEEMCPLPSADILSSHRRMILTQRSNMSSPQIRRLNHSPSVNICDSARPISNRVLFKVHETTEAIMLQNAKQN